MKSLRFGMTFIAAGVLSFWFASLAPAADKKKAKEGEPKAGVFEGADDSAKEEEGFGEGNKAKDDAAGKKKGKKNAKDAEAEKKDAAGAKPEVGDKKPMDDKGEKGDEGGFGEGRAKADAEKSKGIDPAELEANKDLAKYVKGLEKQFKKKDGYYVIMTSEVGVAPDKQAAQGDKVAMKAYSLLNYEVLEGQQAAIARVVKFIGEFDPPWEKKQAAKAKRGEGGGIPAPPKPKRNWKFVSYFPPSKEGAIAAEDARNRAQMAHEAQEKAMEERNKPRNNNYQ